MERFSRTHIVLLFWFIIVSLQILPTIVEGGEHVAENQQEKLPSITKIATDTISLLKQFHQSSCDRIKTVIKAIQLKYSPPNLDFRGKDKANHEEGTGGRTSAGGKMKVAAEKSFGTTKENVEESAKSAAKVVGDAVHKTAQRVKRSVTEDETNAEI